MTDDAPEFPRKGGRQSGTTHAYTVEARVDLPTAKNINNVIYDQRWRQIEFAQVFPGQGVPSARTRHMGIVGLLDYEAAQALRWWFHAHASAYEPGGGMGLVTRIVRHQVKYQWEQIAVSADEYIGRDLDILFGEKLVRKESEPTKA